MSNDYRVASSLLPLRRLSLGGRLLAELYWRVNSPFPLSRQAWVDAGYCLDAPEEMAAGSCLQDTVELGEGEIMLIPVQRTWWRE